MKSIKIDLRKPYKQTCTLVSLSRQVYTIHLPTYIIYQIFQYLYAYFRYEDKCETFTQKQCQLFYTTKTEVQCKEFTRNECQITQEQQCKEVCKDGQTVYDTKEETTYENVCVEIVMEKCEASYENKCEDVCETDCSDGGGAIADEAIGTGLTDSYGPPAVSRNNLNRGRSQITFAKRGEGGLVNCKLYYISLMQ